MFTYFLKNIPQAVASEERPNKRALQASVGEAGQKLMEADQKLMEAGQKLMEAEQKLMEAERKLMDAERKLMETKRINENDYLNSSAAGSFKKMMYENISQCIQKMNSEEMTVGDFNLSDEDKDSQQLYSWKNILHNMTDEEISKPIEERWFRISHHFEWIFEEIQHTCYANGYYLLFEFQGKHDTFTLSNEKPVGYSEDPLLSHRLNRVWIYNLFGYLDMI